MRAAARRPRRQSAADARRALRGPGMRSGKRPRRGAIRPVPSSLLSDDASSSIDTFRVGGSRAERDAVDRALAARLLLVTAANFVFFLNFASFFLLPASPRAARAPNDRLRDGDGRLHGIVVLPFLGVLLDRVDRRRL
jgi:hypothetical protein